jgi:ubiquinone/menaquinone biosynthesis C-methylase UbiE
MRNSKQIHPSNRDRITIFSLQRYLDIASMNKFITTKICFLSCFIISSALSFSQRHTTHHRARTMTEESKDWGDKWSDQAKLYSDQVARLTGLHGADLVALLKDDILNAKTILDVGCGTGAFAMAYLQQFPMGIPGQTLISSDLSASMLEKAKESMKPNGDFQTKMLFQEEDGTKLEGIADDSVDIVVSLFGVFLIPDQEGTRKAIQRVLKKPNGVVAIASWRFGVSDNLCKQEFGVSLQDAFEAAVMAISPNMAMMSGSIKDWATDEGARRILSENYKLDSVEVFSALHSTVWNLDNLWMVVYKNPVSNIESAPEADAGKAKDALFKFVTQGGKYPLERPMILQTASNLCVGRGLASS